MPNRRDFLKVSAAASVASAAMTMKASSYDSVAGANERVNLAFLGVGGRCQQHIDIVNALARANANSVRPVAVCDVWDGDETLSNGTGRGRIPSVRSAGSTWTTPPTLPRIIAVFWSCAKWTPCASPPRTTGTPR